ncbi:MAG: hypothetical protein AABW58_02635 [Nanoarchaeota archaeon]
MSELTQSQREERRLAAIALAKHSIQIIRRLVKVNHFLVKLFL